MNSTRQRISTCTANVQDSIHRSTAVGQPLLLLLSVLLAIRDAVSAVVGTVQPPLIAPATSESILRPIEAVRAQTAG